ncbi:MAG: hypothetical protein ABIB43_04830 [archaeon]
MGIKKLYKSLEETIKKHPLRVYGSAFILSIPLFIHSAYYISEPSDPLLDKYNKIVSTMNNLEYYSSFEEIVDKEGLTINFENLKEQKEEIENLGVLDDIKKDDFKDSIFASVYLGLSYTLGLFSFCQLIEYAKYNDLSFWNLPFISSHKHYRPF